MPTTLIDASSFDPVTAPIGTDIRNAASVRAALQTTANRTRFLYDRLTPLADIAALKAVAAVDDLVRLVQSKGVYVFDSASALAEQLPYVVAPNAGSGRWLHVDGVPPPKQTTFTLPVVPLGFTTVVGAFAAIGAGSEGASNSFAVDNGIRYDFAIEGFRFRAAHTSSAAHFGVLLDLNPHLIQGAWLVSARVRLTGASGHTALPQVMPCFGIFRRTHETGAVVNLLSTPVSGCVSDIVGSVAAYQAAHQFTFFSDQNHLIDTSLYQYMAVLYDEGGTDARAFTTYHGIQLNF